MKPITPYWKVVWVIAKKDLILSKFGGRGPHKPPPGLTWGIISQILEKSTSARRPGNQEISQDLNSPFLFNSYLVGRRHSRLIVAFRACVPLEEFSSRPGQFLWEQILHLVNI